VDRANSSSAFAFRLPRGLKVTDFDADGPHQAALIRMIEPKDDLILRVIVRDSIRFCKAIGAGTGLSVDEKEALSLLYSAPRSAYFVADRRDTVVGGAGIGVLPCDFTHIAELQRFVLLPMNGYLDIGRRLLDQSLDSADRFGFRLCYVELKSEQITMRELLERAGFKPTVKPLREVGDRGADSFYTISLTG